MEGEDGRADHDHEVVRTQCLGELRGRGMQEARELRMCFRKRAARRERADPNRGSCPLRDLDHEIDGVRAIDTGADHQRGIFARRQRRDQRLHCGSIGADLAADAAGFNGLRWMRPVVDRDRDEGRAAWRLHRHVIGARDRRRHILGPRRLDREFHVGPGKFRRPLGIEKGLQRQDRTRLLARGDHERGLVTVRGIDVAERIADAGCRMQIDEAGIAGGLGVAVGHADDARLLQAEHIVDVVGPVAQERQFGRTGIAEHASDAERAERSKVACLTVSGAGWFVASYAARSLDLCCRHELHLAVVARKANRNRRCDPVRDSPRARCMDPPRPLPASARERTSVDVISAALTTLLSPSWWVVPRHSRSIAPCCRHCRWR